MSERKDLSQSTTGWQPEIDDLRHRESLARELGGADKVARQRAGGRLTVRERIDAIADPNSFREIGTLAGNATYDSDGRLESFTPSNRVMGRAQIGGRPVVITGDDFTVRGGSADATIAGKAIYAEQMANEMQLPIVRLIEGSGGGGSVKTIETTGRANLPGGLGPSQDWYYFASNNLATVPVVALGLGSVPGSAPRC